MFQIVSKMMKLILFTACAMFAQTTVTEQQVPVAQLIFTPCANELVAVSGEAHLHSVLTVTPNGIGMESGFNYSNIKGVGQNTGISYVVTGANQVSFHTSPVSGVISYTIPGELKLISWRGMFFVSFLEKMSLDIATGTITVMFDNFRARCL